MFFIIIITITNSIILSCFFSSVIVTTWLKSSLKLTWQPSITMFKTWCLRLHSEKLKVCSRYNQLGTSLCQSWLLVIISESFLIEFPFQTIS